MKRQDNKTKLEVMDGFDFELNNEVGCRCEDLIGEKLS